MPSESREKYYLVDKFESSVSSSLSVDTNSGDCPCPLACECLKMGGSDATSQRYSLKIKHVCSPVSNVRSYGKSSQQIESISVKHISCNKTALASCAHLKLFSYLSYFTDISNQIFSRNLQLTNDAGIADNNHQFSVPSLQTISLDYKPKNSHFSSLFSNFISLTYNGSSNIFSCYNNFTFFQIFIFVVTQYFKPDTLAAPDDESAHPSVQSSSSSLVSRVNTQTKRVSNTSPAVHAPFIRSFWFTIFSLLAILCCSTSSLSAAHCEEGLEFFNSYTKRCQNCTVCTDPYIRLMPCYEYQDGLCGYPEDYVKVKGDSQPELKKKNKKGGKKRGKKGNRRGGKRRNRYNESNEMNVDVADDFKRHTLNNVNALDDAQYPLQPHNDQESFSSATSYSLPGISDTTPNTTPQTGSPQWHQTLPPSSSDGVGGHPVVPPKQTIIPSLSSGGVLLTGWQASMVLCIAILVSLLVVAVFIFLGLQLLICCKDEMLRCVREKKSPVNTSNDLLLQQMNTPPSNTTSKPRKLGHGLGKAPEKMIITRTYKPSPDRSLRGSGGLKGYGNSSLGDTYINGSNSANTDSFLLGSDSSFNSSPTKETSLTLPSDFRKESKMHKRTDRGNVVLQRQQEVMNDSSIRDNDDELELPPAPPIPTSVSPMHCNTLPTTYVRTTPLPATADNPEAKGSPIPYTMDRLLEQRRRLGCGSSVDTNIYVEMWRGGSSCTASPALHHRNTKGTTSPPSSVAASPLLVRSHHRYAPHHLHFAVTSSNFTAPAPPVPPLPEVSNIHRQHNTLANPTNNLNRTSVTAPNNAMHHQNLLNPPNVSTNNLHNINVAHSLANPVHMPMSTQGMGRSTLPHHSLAPSTRHVSNVQTSHVGGNSTTPRVVAWQYK